MDEELRKVVEQFPRARWQFEMTVEAAAMEAIEIAKQISSALGEVSINELKEAIIREFTKSLNVERYFGEFNEQSRSKRDIR